MRPKETISETENLGDDDQRNTEPSEHQTELINIKLNFHALKDRSCHLTRGHIKQ